MLFYILDNDDKHTFLGGIEEYAVYVEPSSNLMLNRSNNEEAQSLGYGDYQIASQTSIQNILNALNDLQYEPYRVCRRVNILRDYSDEKTNLYPRN